MLKKMRTILIFIFAIIFVFTNLSGCIKDASKDEIPSTQSDGKNDEPGQSAEVQDDTPIEYKLMFAENASMPVRDTWVILKELEERTNIKINLMPIPSSAWTDKLNITLASGELPDIINTVSLDTLNEFGPKGMFLNIWEYKDYMPNLVNMMKVAPFLKSYMFSNNELYAMPSGISSKYLVDYSVYFVPMIRTDLLEKHSLDIPKTYDDLYVLLKSLKELYPNSYPWVTRLGIPIIISTLAPSLGLKTDPGGYGGVGFTEFNENTRQYNSVLENSNFKDFIEYMAKMYKEELFDKEYVITSTKQWEEKIISSKGFFTIDYFSRPDMMTNIAVDSGDSEFALEAILPPTTVGGESKVYAYLTADLLVGISNKIKEPERLMKLYDFWFYSEEGSLLSCYGIEGISYNLDGKNISHIYEEDTKSVLDITSKYGVSYGGFFGITPDRYGYKFEDPSMSANYRKTWDLFENASVDMLPFLSFNKDEIEIKKELDTNLGEYIVTSLNKFIMGEDDLKTWDKFILECDKKGMEDLVKIANAAQARLDEK